jgi:pimeloyl-ACP methyl ester carboxylesterase
MHQCTSTHRGVIFIGLALFTCVPGFAPAQAPKEIPFREGLALAPAGRGGRVAIPIDPVGARLAAGTWQKPKAGDEFAGRTWTALTAKADGSFQDRALAGGYVHFSILAETEGVMVLEAAGHALVWVNGEPRAGDPYSYGYVQVPVQLKKGENEFLFAGGRGQLRAKLTAPKSPLFLNTADLTLPDLLAGQKYEGWAAVPVVNATTAWQSGLNVVTALAGAALLRTDLPPLPPLSVMKVPIRIQGPAAGPTEKLAATLELQRRGPAKDDSFDQVSISLRVLKPEQTHKRTFRSGIDGSVQYYALVPAAPGKETPGLTLTLHGAGVEGLGQAACFTPKTWTHVVAATNRRPFGFDWEDWGRLDALEVLDDAMRELRPDPKRVWLTGHSMGGHGTWHLGVTYPGKFAAIGPSAGWVSMMSYAGARRPENPDALTELFSRACSPSDTLALAKNLTALGVYVLHGDQDDNVPVAQARTMRKTLGEFHADWVYYERPGAGHWWGNPCVDWPDMFEFFAKRSIPENGQVRRVEFSTASPGVSAECHWALIDAQQKAFRLSSVQLTHDPAKGTFAGTTENVARLALDVGHLKPGEPLQVTLDGQKLVDVPWPGEGTKLWFARDGERWAVAAKISGAEKSHRRCGPFRDVFRNRVLFVIGTHGSPEENAWALQKARIDAESFWYRGNGCIEIVTDADFDASKEPDRNVVLYGNADTNSAWKALLGDSPVQVRSGRLTVGGREEKGAELGCLFVRPRPMSDVALVGAVTGTGLKGMRLTDRLPYFISGVGYPDCVLLGPEALTKGLAGVKAAGFFGPDWSVDRGEFVWR